MMLHEILGAALYAGAVLVAAFATFAPLFTEGDQ